MRFSARLPKSITYWINFFRRPRKTVSKQSKTSHLISPMESARELAACWQQPRTTISLRLWLINTLRTHKEWLLNMLESCYQRKRQLKKTDWAGRLTHRCLEISRLQRILKIWWRTLLLHLRTVFQTQTPLSEGQILPSPWCRTEVAILQVPERRTLETWWYSAHHRQLRIKITNQISISAYSKPKIADIAIKRLAETDEVI